MSVNLISKLENQNLDYIEMSQIMQEILTGKTNTEQNVKFLSNLDTREQTNEEMTSMLDKMIEHSLQIQPSHDAIDVCGTGGDNLNTFNVSTTVSFVLAAAKVKVAKHGNRSSRISGSADIFEELGYNLMLDSKEIHNILQRHNICFMFAPKFHPAMRYIADARKKIQKKTVFNILGPLCNPADVKMQLIGVSNDALLERLVKILYKKGSKNIMTVTSKDNMDELSSSTKNKICHLHGGKIHSSVIDPQALGLKESSIKDITINSKDDAISAFVNVLNNSANTAMIQTVSLNAAAGLVVADIAKDIKEGLEISQEIIQSERAYKILEQFVQDCGDITKLKEVSN